jgi:hypothetical protein
MHVQHAINGHPDLPAADEVRLPLRPRRLRVRLCRLSATHCALRPAGKPAPSHHAAPRPLCFRRRPWCDERVISAVHGPTAAADQDGTGLVFVAEMYGLQLDQLAELLGLTARQARAAAGRWVGHGLAESAVLSPGPPWLWLTRAGLLAVGTRYPAAPPALPRLAHIRAVTAVRLALESVAAYREGGAHWRSERNLRARLGGRVGARDHLPDAEVHWPDDPAAAPGPPWAGECWAIEAELTPKTMARTAAIMRELLGRTGDYGCPAA